MGVKMDLKKAASACLCVLVTAGSAGCYGNYVLKSSEPDLAQLTEAYVDALNDFDADAVLGLTSYEEDDEEYKDIKRFMDPEFSKETWGTDLLPVCEYIASTITMDYDSDDLTVNKGRCILRVTYEIVDWDSVFDVPCGSMDELIDNLKAQKDTVSYVGRLTFTGTDNDWKISKISDLSELFEFTRALPVIPEINPTEPDIVETEPVDTEPSDITPTGIDPTGTVFADTLSKAADDYIAVLEQNREAIQKVENIYGINPVGLYDITGDTIPELYFFAGDDDKDNSDSATLHIYAYSEYRGWALEVLSVPGILNNGQVSGEYILYSTGNELIVTQTHGETFTLNVVSQVYDTRWDQVSAFSRMAVFERICEEEYDPDTGESAEIYRYTLNGEDIQKDEYMSSMKDYTERTEMVLGRKFVLSSADPEYGLMSKPANSMWGFGIAVEYITSLV